LVIPPRSSQRTRRISYLVNLLAEP
jgi:hypothetical protein